MSKFETRFVFAMLMIISLVGCGGGGGSSKASSNGAFSEIAAISVNCDSSDGGPAACNNSQSGKPVLLAWTSQACGAITWSNLAAIEETSLSCVSGLCYAHDSVSWRSPSTGETVYEIGGQNRTAVAWLNLVNNGVNDDSQPQSGDVVCCEAVAVQNADSYANMQSDKCSAVP